MSEEQSEADQNRTRRPLIGVQQTEPRPFLGALLVLAGILVLVLVALSIVLDIP